MDVGQLAGRVVLIGAFEQGGFVVAAAQQLFLQAPGRVPLLGLEQVVALVAGDLHSTKKILFSYSDFCQCLF